MKLFALSAFVLAATLSASGSAHASPFSSDHDVVRSGYGHIVFNTWGHCVLTKWESGQDTCTDKIRTELLNVYFDFDSAELTESGKRKLNDLAAILASSDDVLSADIVGYADYLGYNAYNRELSKRRAETVRHYLENHGYLDTRNVTVMALGENQPLNGCSELSGEERRACLWRDRRVEIKLNYRKDSK